MNVRDAALASGERRVAIVRDATRDVDDAHDDPRARVHLVATTGNSQLPVVLPVVLPVIPALVGQYQGAGVLYRRLGPNR